MFKKLRRHIYLCLMIISFLMAGATVILSVGITAGSLWSTYETIAADSLKRNVDSCSMYISSVQISAADVARNARVTSELVNNEGISLAQTLDDACNFAMQITAITVYSLDGRTYTSSGINDIPAYDALAEIQGFQEFMDSGENSLFSVRTDVIAKIYNRNAYSQSKGIITCFEKIFDENGDVLGIVAADILPEALYDILSASDSGSKAGGLSLISLGGTYLLASGNSAYASEMASLSSSNTVSSDGKYIYVLADESMYGCTVTNAVKLSPLYKDIAVEAALIIATGIIVEVCVHFVLRAMSRRMTSRLDRLYCKMEKDEAGFA